MKRLLIFCFPVLIISACKKQSCYVDPSSCIQTKIDSGNWKGAPTGNSVKQYEFKQKIVFVFEANPVADAASAVYDQDCNRLGILGGLAGIREIEGVDFYANARYIRTIWHD
ncbi:MAG TPA: hypothetical protein VHK91_09235 [Flavisolibacter sp.]|jgi:hypothetical protein|nr:hypothetical protein [Flavisolibacter sp.]